MYTELVSQSCPYCAALVHKVSIKVCITMHLGTSNLFLPGNK